MKIPLCKTIPKRIQKILKTRRFKYEDWDIMGLYKIIPLQTCKKGEWTTEWGIVEWGWADNRRIDLMCVLTHEVPFCSTACCYQQIFDVSDTIKLDLIKDKKK